MEVTDPSPSGQSTDEVHHDQVLGHARVQFQLEQGHGTSRVRTARESQEVVQFLDEHGECINVAIVEPRARVVPFKMPDKPVRIVKRHANWV